MRVLALAPTTRDGEVTQSLLAKAGMPAVLCKGIRGLVHDIGTGAAAVVLTEEVIVSDCIEELIQVLRRQPSWSELPFVVLMRSGIQSAGTLAALSALG